MKHMFSKKEALSKATLQFEDEVSQMVASMKLKSEAETSRAQTLLQTKELFKEIKGDEGQELHFQERMEKLEALEAHLQSCEKSLESERTSGWKEACPSAQYEQIVSCCSRQNLEESSY